MISKISKSCWATPEKTISLLPSFFSLDLIQLLTVTKIFDATVKNSNQVFLSVTLHTAQC